MLGASHPAELRSPAANCKNKRILIDCHRSVPIHSNKLWMYAPKQFATSTCAVIK